MHLKYVAYWFIYTHIKYKYIYICIYREIDISIPIYIYMYWYWYTDMLLKGYCCICRYIYILYLHIYIERERKQIYLSFSVIWHGVLSLHCVVLYCLNVLHFLGKGWWFRVFGFRVLGVGGFGLSGFSVWALGLPNLMVLGRWGCRVSQPNLKACTSKGLAPSNLNLQTPNP